MDRLVGCRSRPEWKGFDRRPHRTRVRMYSSTVRHGQMKIVVCSPVNDSEPVWRGSSCDIRSIAMKYMLRITLLLAASACLA